MACKPEEYDTLPSYFELFQGIYDFILKTVRENFHESGELLETRSWHTNFSILDVILVLLMSVTFAVFRHYATKYLFIPLGDYLQLTPANRKKMPESAWKFVFYLSAWSYSLYVVILSGKYCFFQKPSIVWEGWNLDTDLPFDMYMIYLIQSGFYVHSLYATLFLDTWRKDSIVMMVHHVVTLALITFSYTIRYHNIGVVVVFLHDMCDIQLEFMKLNVYFKIQDGKLVHRHEVLANLSCLCFTITWFFSRLYLFPLKVIYSSTAIVSRDNLNLVLPCAILMNSLLLLLQAMNIYWFLFVVVFLIRVFTGQVQELDDTREYDVEDKFSQQLSAQFDGVPPAVSTASKENHAAENNSVVDKDGDAKDGVRKRVPM